MILLQLYWEFFKTGLFAVGGGLATLPFLSKMADKTGWFTQGQLMDMVAVSESTPGPIGINMATYVGFSTSGVPGALAATLGLITPSIIIILIIASFLKAFRSNRYVDSAFRCLRPASTGLIAASGLSVAVDYLLYGCSCGNSGGGSVEGGSACSSASCGYPGDSANQKTAPCNLDCTVRFAGHCVLLCRCVNRQKSKRARFTAGLVF